MFSFNTEKVNYEEEVREGAHGTVYAYQHKQTDDDAYVVKRVMTPQVDTMISTVQEIVLGFSCDHPHVLPIKGYHLSYDKSKKFWDIFIKMPRMQTSLKTRIDEYARQGKSFKEEEIVRYFYTLTLGLKYLHERHIAHRDIKPDNILVDKQDNLKIADVGIAKLVEDEDRELLTQALGTPLYTAPEVLTNARELKKRDLFTADIWSLGIIMTELCVPKTRLINTTATGKANEIMLAEILRGLQERYGKVLTELISSLLRADPKERKSLEEVQKTLKETYPHILAQDAKNKENKVEDENKFLKSRLSDLQQQVQDLQNELEALRLLASENNQQLTNPDLKSEEQKVEEREANTHLFQGICWKTLQEHNDRVTSLALVSPTVFASGSHDHTIKLWDIKTGTYLKTLKGHTHYVTSVQALSSDELASSACDNSIKVWNVKTGACIKTLEDNGFVICPLPEYQLASGGDDEIKIWNMKTHSCVTTWKVGDERLVSLRFLPVRNQLATGHYCHNVVKLWDLNTGACVITLKGHTNGVSSIRMLPSGELVSASSDKTIKLWDLNTGACIKTLEGHTAAIECLELLSTGELASGSTDRRIKIWDTKQGICIDSVQAHKFEVCSLQVLPTGGLVSGSMDGTIKLWN